MESPDVFKRRRRQLGSSPISAEKQRRKLGATRCSKVTRRPLQRIISWRRHNSSLAAAAFLIRDASVRGVTVIFETEK